MNILNKIRHVLPSLSFTWLTVSVNSQNLDEFRMQPERYYGRIFFLREVWDAGYDTKEA